jgi:hypothetical protein
MTNGATAAGQWWVIQRATGARGGPPQYIAQQATSPPPGEVAGPFKTESEARQWILNAQSQTTFPAAPSIPNPFGFLAALGWIQEIGHWAGIVVAAVTDIHTYISVGWLALGFWMLVIGILLWLKIPQRAAGAAREAGEAAGAAAVAA